MTYGWKESEDLLVDFLAHRKMWGILQDFSSTGISMGVGTVLMTGERELPEQVAEVIADCGYTSACDEFSYQMKKCFHLPVTAPILFLTNLISKEESWF